MTWPRALTYVGVWLLLTIFWVGRQQSVPERVPQSSFAETPFGALKAADVVEIELESDGQTLHASLNDGRWEVSRPAGATLAVDLIRALVDAVLEVEEVKTVRSESSGPDEYGLADPAARVTFHTARGASVRVLLGNLNPARTAIYGRVEGAPEVVLLGLNLRYYLRMALQGVAPDTPTG